jgi:transcriptional regulator of acetoin/glycerol metabolism
MGTQPPAIVTTEQFAEEVAALARRYERGKEQERQLADTVEARMLQTARARKDWKEAEEALPGLLVEARNAGWQPKQIARILDLTESYVYRKLREFDSEQ